MEYHWKNFLLAFSVEFQFNAIQSWSIFFIGSLYSKADDSPCAIFLVLYIFRTFALPPPYTPTLQLPQHPLRMKRKRNEAVYPQSVKYYVWLARSHSAVLFRRSYRLREWIREPLMQQSRCLSQCRNESNWESLHHPTICNADHLKLFVLSQWCSELWNERQRDGKRDIV